METPSQGQTPANPFGEQFRTFHFYPSESHKHIVHRITRGLEANCGLTLLTGEIGIGKTSVCRYLMQSFGASYIFAESGNPFLKPAEQLYHFCKQFGVDTTGRNSIHDLTDALHTFFMEQAELGKKPVIIMDESHLLATEHFSLLLVLYNMRQGSTPLVQIILIGQVEIMDRLREPGFEALNQRIGVRCELTPLTAEETRNYIQFKLEHAEFPNQNVFEQKTLKKIWQVTGGLPRLINHACSHALDHITFTGAQSVSEKLIDEVSSDPMYQDLFTIRTKKDTQKYRAAAAIVAIIFVGIFAATQLTMFSGTTPEAEDMTVATTSTQQTAPQAAAPQKTASVQAAKNEQPIPAQQVTPAKQVAVTTPPATVTKQAAVQNTVPAPQANPVQQVAQAEVEKTVQLKAVQVTRPASVQGSQPAPITVTPVQSEPVLTKPANTVAQTPPVKTVRPVKTVQPPVASVQQPQPVQQVQPAQQAVTPAQPSVPTNQQVLPLQAPASTEQTAVAQAGTPQAVEQPLQAAPTKSVEQPQAPATLANQQPEQNTQQVAQQNAAPVVSLPPLGTKKEAHVPAYATAPAPQEASAPKAESTLILDEDTHPAIRALEVSAVAWSEKPEARMVVVNDRIFHEGDKVGALTLEKINKSYLIFSLDGIRYRKNAS
ncbi:AAA family ATPase [Halodesulfovibrio spirochaetisodalis]|uniref:Uncharacterized protein n=1 Tax=Halodesulfovibrio spirochaetisodalis TaxID=1560234 RepID=A0A1B7XB40_9BACT|nr:AAA family ATPase [Halodesulfovibrio spirochaetisodalis]OBQ46591.1 hypothetical protein SP90_11330 [Halodesulfovibrio spirochaetisodalis]